jgi:hypothetical protein
MIGWPWPRGQWNTLWLDNLDLMVSGIHYDWMTLTLWLMEYIMIGWPWPQGQWNTLWLDDLDLRVNGIHNDWMTLTSGSVKYIMIGWPWPQDQLNTLWLDDLDLGFNGIRYDWMTLTAHPYGNVTKSYNTSTTIGVINNNKKTLCNRWFMYECVFIRNATVLVYALECFAVAGIFLHAFSRFNVQ